MSMRARSIRITQREWDALVNAMAEYQVNEDELDPERREDLRAHTRVIGRWFAAGR
jgi:hypothetical protein